VVGSAKEGYGRMHCQEAACGGRKSSAKHKNQNFTRKTNQSNRQKAVQIRQNLISAFLHPKVL